MSCHLIYTHYSKLTQSNFHTGHFILAYLFRCGKVTYLLSVCDEKLADSYPHVPRPILPHGVVYVWDIVHRPLVLSVSNQLECTTL